jgi:CheY-like chemotaxis protein
MAVPHPVARDATLTGVHVLIVDDHADTLAMLGSTFEYCGARASTASCARQALDAIRTDPPSVIVTDVAMPAEDGLWLIERLRASNPEIPVIALTGYALSRATAAMFVAVYMKPMDPFDLCRAAAAVLAGRSLPDQG